MLIGITKLATGHITVANKLHQWKLCDNDWCPFCGHPKIVDNSFQCNHTVIIQYWEDAVKDLGSYLQNIYTYINVVVDITRNLFVWKNGTELSEDKSGSLVSEAINSQTEIGWRQL